MNVRLKPAGSLPWNKDLTIAQPWPCNVLNEHLRLSHHFLVLFINAFFDWKRKIVGKTVLKKKCKFSNSCHDLRLCFAKSKNAAMLNVCADACALIVIVIDCKLITGVLIALFVN